MIFYVLLSFAFSAFFVQASPGSLGIMKGFSSAPQNTSSLVKRDNDLTFYNPGPPGSPGMSACEIPITDNDYIAALSFMDFGYDNPPRNSRWCNQCIRVFNGDASIAAKVVDKCEACKSRDVDLSPVAFNFIAQASQGRIPNIQFKEVDNSECTGASSYRKGPYSAPNLIAPPAQPQPQPQPQVQINPVPFSAVVPASAASPSSPVSVDSSSSVQPVYTAGTPGQTSTTNPLVGQMFSGSQTPYYSCLASLAFIAMLNCFLLFT